MGLNINGLPPRAGPGGRIARDRQRVSPAPDAVQRREPPERQGGYERGDERRHGEIVELDRAVREAERATAVLVEAEAGLAAAESTLAELVRRLEGEAAQAGIREAPQPPWLADLLARLDAIGRGTRFGSASLLDGTLGCTGAAAGAGLQFVSAGREARASPAQGFAVAITRAPRRATLVSEVAADALEPGAPLTLSVSEEQGGARYATQPGEPLAAAAERFQACVDARGLPLAVYVNDERRLVVEHRRYGAGYRFIAESSQPGVLSTLDGQPRLVADGHDVEGAINGEPAVGIGATLVGQAGNPTTAGLAVRYCPPPADDAAGTGPETASGRVLVAQNRLQLPLPGEGALTLTVRLDAVRADALARDVETASGFGSLARIRVATPLERADALRMARRAFEDLSARRGMVRALLRDKVMPAVRRLRVEAQNLCAAERPLAPPHGMLDAVRSLSRRIRLESRAALQAQRPAPAGSMMGLLRDE